MPPFPERTTEQHLNSLQSFVLSAFNTAPHVPNSSNHGVKRRRRDDQSAAPLQRISVINAVDDLCCVSTETGASRLSHLKQSLQSRSYSPAQLATQIFICDEVDTGPPLCSAVSLLEGRLIHLNDVQPVALLSRAILELRNPDTCSCRGEQSGVHAIIRFILKDTTSTKRDLFVKHFLTVLFQDAHSSSPMPQTKERFRLAEHLLWALQAEEFQQEDASKIYEWVRHASLLTRTATDVQNKSNSSYWTAELSGLATGGSTWEYLTYGKVEERALTKLFKLLPPLKSMQVYFECLNSFFRPTMGSSLASARANGSWSRVVILGRRVLDTSTFTDADVELKRRIQSSLNGLLAAAASSNQCQDVAILLCLIRCVLIPCGILKETSTNPKEFKEYEGWFRDVVGKSDAISVATLLTTLGELVPLEPLKLLRVNHRVLSLKREHARMTANYLISLRARIGDLDSARSERLLNPVAGNHDSIASMQNSPKRMEDEVIQFVFEFSKHKLLPSSLVRKMNFHRYYFRTKILKSLFDPFLSERLSEKRFNGQVMSAASFDECRIDMIKELAFNRKDKAVSGGEAREAIGTIVSAKLSMKKTDGSDGPREKVIISVAAKSSSVKDICAAIFKESKAKSGRSSDTHDETKEVALANVDVLVEKIETMWKAGDEPSRGPEIAAELLHGMTSALDEAGRSRYPELFEYKSRDACDVVLKVYLDWWDAHGFGLVETIRRLLESPSVGKMKNLLQYQFLGLLCAGDGCLTTGSTVSLAMFAIGLVETGTTAALMDTLMLSKSSTPTLYKDFLLGVVSCLPLGRADVVTVSMTFAIHCICLLVTAYDHISPSGRDKRGLRINSIRIENRDVRLVELPVYRSLLDFLRWIICHPWRLSAFQAKGVLPSRIKLLADAVPAINFVTRLLVSPKVPISHDFTIEQYVCIEARCGWGRAVSVYEELKKRESIGVNPSHIVCRFALFLSKRNSAKWPSVAWMEEGLMRYAAETSSCRALEMSGHTNLSDSLRFLERSVKSDGTGVGYRLLDQYSRMQVCYFHGYGAADIEKHLTSALVPWYWPFSAQIVDFLWGSLGKHCLTLESDYSRVKDNYLLVSNFALYDSLRADQVRGIQGQASGRCAVRQHPDNMVSRISNLREAMEELSAMESGLDRSLGSQVVTSLVPRFSLPEASTKAFGSCAVLDLVRKCHLLQKNTVGARIRKWVPLVGSIVNEASLAEFLVASLTVASLLPFTGLAGTCNRRDEVTMITDDILIELAEEHAQLLCEGASPFQWTNTLLSSSSAHHIDIRTSMMMWLGWDGSSEMLGKKWNFECLPVDVCMGRLFQSMGALCKESLHRIISNVGQGNLSNCLIPNILRTRGRLLSYSSRNENLKLSQSSYIKLLDCKEKLANKMITVVVRLLSSAREVIPDFGDSDAIEAVKLFPECRDEVISAMVATTSKEEQS